VMAGLAAALIRPAPPRQADDRDQTDGRDQAEDRDQASDP
jgi:hypothetical protein